MPVVTGADLAKGFGAEQIFSGVSFEIQARDRIALVGVNGSGKTTLLRIIAGLEKSDTGTVNIEGVNATNLPAQKRNVGFVFQHYAAFKHMSVAKNVAFGPVSYTHLTLPTKRIV